MQAVPFRHLNPAPQRHIEATASAALAQRSAPPPSDPRAGARAQGASCSARCGRRTAGRARPPWPRAAHAAGRCARACAAGPRGAKPRGPPSQARLRSGKRVCVRVRGSGGGVCGEGGGHFLVPW
eukprot:364835-Chlamydomonas_euryale.AAC.4